MRIILFSINYAPEPIGIGKYNGELVEWLVSKGHEVRVVTSAPYYPNWRVYEGFHSSRYVTETSGSLTVYRCPIYVPGQLSLIKRLLHLFSFALSSLPVLFRQWMWRPDTIIVVIPTLFCAPQAALFARLSRALSVVHIQDFELDALFGLNMIRMGFIHRLGALFESFVLGRFDRVSTISSGMLKRARAKGVQEAKLRYFPNWCELERFRGAVRSPVLLERLGLNSGNRIVLYSGNIGEKQGLEILVDCARYFRANRDITFLIVGEGGGKARLLELVELSGLKNIVLLPLQPLEDLSSLLASAHCHLVIQRRDIADAVMPSKLTNILAVGGNSVITADPDTSLGELCRDFQGIATLVAPESVDELTHGIEIALGLPRPNQVALSYAEQHLSKENILSCFFDQIEAEVTSRKLQSDR